MNASAAQVRNSSQNFLLPNHWIQCSTINICTHHYVSYWEVTMLNCLIMQEVLLGILILYVEQPKVGPGKAYHALHC